MKLHKSHPRIRRLLAREDAMVVEMNKVLGTDYENYVDYMERNKWNDAAYTVEELKALVARKR